MPINLSLNDQDIPKPVRSNSEDERAHQENKFAIQTALDLILSGQEPVKPIDGHFLVVIKNGAIQESYLLSPKAQLPDGLPANWMAVPDPDEEDASFNSVTPTFWQKIKKFFQRGNL